MFLCDVFDLKIQTLGPASPGTAALAEPVAVLSQRFQGGLHASVKIIAVDDHPSADVHDVGHRFVADGTNAHAGITCRARPNRLPTDRVTYERLPVGAAASKAKKVFIKEVAFVDLQSRRGERPALGVGRAYVVTAVAHNAGVGVQQPRPRQIMKGFRARIDAVLRLPRD